MRPFLIAICAIAVLPTALTARILAYFPAEAPSHHFFFQPILYELAVRGHEIDYFSPFPMKRTHVSVTHVRLETSKPNEFTELYDVSNYWKYSVQRQVVMLLNAVIESARKTCETETARDLLASQARYDVILHENFIFGEAGSVLQHKFNVTSVTLSAIDSLNTNVLSGLAQNPSNMVNCFSPYSDRMSFLERVHNTYLMAMALFHYYDYLRAIQQVADDCYRYPGWENRPNLRELVSNQAVILANQHPSVGYATPRSPHVKYVGGAVLSPRISLPADLEKFIREAEDGVIYFSLGSLFDLRVSMSHLTDVFVKAFAQRRERILWKWNGEPWEGLPPSIRLSKWFPQQDVLAQENVKLFITHGGLQSCFETVNFGIPVVVIPCFLDQTNNALSLAQHGYGVVLSLTNVTLDSLNWALTETLDNPQYKQRVLKGSDWLRDVPVSPVKEAAYWIEYAIRHGNALQPAGAKMSFLQLHAWDVYAFLFAALTCSLYFMKFALALVIKTLETSVARRTRNFKKFS